MPAEWYEVVSRRPGPEVTDATMRRKIEESGQPWKVRDRATGIEMVLVMPGEFLMGSPESEPGRNADEGPQHRVRLTRAFYLGATEVTQAQWKRSMGSVSFFFKGDSKPVTPSWVGAQAYLAKANGRRPGRNGVAASAHGGGVGIRVSSGDDQAIRFRGTRRA